MPIVTKTKDKHGTPPTLPASPPRSTAARSFGAIEDMVLDVLTPHYAEARKIAWRVRDVHGVHPDVDRVRQALRTLWMTFHGPAWKRSMVRCRLIGLRHIEACLVEVGPDQPSPIMRKHATGRPAKPADGKST